MNDLNKLAGEHWAIEATKFKSLISTMPEYIKQYAGKGDFDVSHTWGGVQQPRVEMHGNVAVIPVYGPMGQNLPPVLKYFGFVDYLDISKAIAQAIKETDIVVLDFDTPGGTVVGCYEVQQQIARLGEDGKVIVSFTNSMRASGGELMSTSCSIVTATPSAMVGSIGTLIAIEDVSKMFESFGIQVELFSSGVFKGMGTPGTSLNDDQRVLLMEEVDEMAEEFKAMVAAYRDVDDSLMQGQTMTAQKAEQGNLVDFISDSLESLVNSLQ